MGSSTILGLVFAVVGFLTACGSQQSEQAQESAQSQEGSGPSQTELRQQTAEAEAPAQIVPTQRRQPTSLPEYEIFDDSVDSTGMRLVYVGTPDGFSAAQQRAIVADVLKDEKG